MRRIKINFVHRMSILPLFVSAKSGNAYFAAFGNAISGNEYVSASSGNACFAAFGNTNSGNAYFAAFW